MYKKITAILLFLLVFSVSWSQTNDNIMTIDQRTYKLWQEKNWKLLLTEGKDALDKGFDFYYLRLRMGIASYEQKNYQRAIIHLEKAKKFNGQEEYLDEYLYYSYVFAGRPGEAKKLASGFNLPLKEKTGTNRKPIVSELSLYYNMDMNSDKTTTSDYSIDIAHSKKGEQYIANNHHLIRLSLTHDISRGFSITHGYSFINQHYFLFKQDSLRDTISDQVSNVHQYFITGNIRLAKNWYMGVGLHYVGVRYTLQQTGPGFGGRRGRSSKATDSDISLFVNVKKMFPYVNAGGAFYYSTLNNDNQLQADIILETYPLGNLNLYTNSILSWQQENISGKATQRFILQQEIGGRIFKYLWMEGYGIFGNVHNFMSADGQIVYNNINTMKLKLGARLIIPVNNRMKFNLGYGYSVNESVYIPEEPDEYIYNKTEYFNHSITGGFIWNFSKPSKY